MRIKKKLAAYERFAEVYDAVGGDDFSLSMLPGLYAILKQYNWQPKLALDLACGTGSVALALAQDGMQMTGIDKSVQMLAKAKQKAQAFPNLPVTFIKGDMRRFTIPQQVELVTCFFDAMNYMVKDEDLLATFRCVAAALQPGGFFVFDLNSIYVLSQVWGNDVFAENYGEVAYIWESNYNTATRCGEMTATFFAKKEESELYERFVEYHVERGYPITDVRKYLEQAGLSVLEVRRKDGRPARENDTRHIYVARKAII